MIKIITDSTSYFKQDEAEEFGIRMLPILYKSGNYIYQEQYSGQDSGFPDSIYSYSTSHPNSQSFESVFLDELSKNEQILCITLSSRLSRTYNSALKAAKRIEGDNIVVFDSLSTAGGLYLLVKKAKRLANEGYTLDEIVEALSKIRDDISTLFFVNDMRSLRRSGRIGMVRMSVTTMMNAKPILRLKEGTIVFSQMAKGYTDSIRCLVHAMPEHCIEAVINYHENTKAAIAVYNAIKTMRPDMPICLRKTGPVLAVHLGAGFVGVSYLI